jgi:LDH2 family malate/lactate/ureidoglycolate dehydrogenase
MPPDTLVITAEPLRRRLSRRLARALGLDRDDAETTVAHWLRSEQAGKPCHGLVRALYVIESGEFGPYDRTPAPAPIRRTPGHLHVDGAGHLGYPIVRNLVVHGCDEAITHGSCVATGVGVYPSGALGDWARLACARGCGVVLMSGSPPRVAAPAGRVPLLGTNPLCIGLPTAPEYFICDASTSALTHGDFLLARGTGAPLPPDSAIDGDGVPTTSATDVGALLSVGGSPKTFAISMAIELLTSLGGGVPGSPRLAEHGVFALFLGPAIVADAAPVLAASLAAFSRTGARIPGWVSQRRADAHARGDTVELSAVTHARLTALLADEEDPA